MALRSSATLLILLLSPVVAAAARSADSPSGRVLELRAERLSAWWHADPLSWDEAVATTCLVVSLVLIAFAIGGTAADLTRKRGSDSDESRWWAVGGSVLAWSLFVRFVVTEPNIFTDGGSGYVRLMRYIEGYGGLATLVKILPASWDAFMWQAMVVPRVLAAFAPALLVAVARGLGCRPPVALFAGVALASVPIHAVLSSSDLLVVPMASVQLGALALVLSAVRSERADVFAAGVGLSAWAMWFRPEGVLGLLPIAAAAFLFPLSWWRRRGVVATVALLAIAVALRGAALATGRTVGVSGGAGLFGNVDWISLLSSTVLVPFWLWLPLPFAFPSLLRQRAVPIVLAGMVAGFLPVYLRGLYPDPANTHLEAVRYGMPLFAWMALGSAVALDMLCRRLLRRSSHGVLIAARVAIAVALALPVVVHRDYLGRRYGHASSERAIRQLLPLVPDKCGLAVPDDLPEAVTIEIHHRYASIAAEAYAAGTGPAVRVVPASEVAAAEAAPEGCWMYLRGPYCYHAYAGVPAAGCTALEARFALEEVASVQIEFRHHRLVTGPEVSRSPWYMESMPIVLSGIVTR